MNILKKLVSAALTTAIVAGIGTSVFAADSSVNIKKTFPDKNLQKICKKYDTDNNGSLSLSELKKFNELAIFSEDEVEDLTGIDKLRYTTRLIVFEGDMDIVNLSKCDSFETVKIMSTNISTFIGGWGIETLELTFCGKLKNVDITRCIYLKDFQFIRNGRFTGYLDIGNSRYLENVTIMDTPLESVEFHPSAQIKNIEVCRTGLEELDLRGMKWSTLREVSVFDNPSMVVTVLPQGSFAALQAGRTKYGYRYSDSQRFVYINNANLPWWK